MLNFPSLVSLTKKASLSLCLISLSCSLSEASSAISDEKLDAVSQTITPRAEEEPESVAEANEYLEKMASGISPYELIIKLSKRYNEKIISAIRFYSEDVLHAADSRNYHVYNLQLEHIRQLSLFDSQFCWMSMKEHFLSWARYRGGIGILGKEARTAAEIEVDLVILATELDKQRVRDLIQFNEYYLGSDIDNVVEFEGYPYDPCLPILHQYSHPDLLGKDLSHMNRIEYGSYWIDANAHLMLQVERIYDEHMTRVRNSSHPHKEEMLTAISDSYSDFKVYVELLRETIASQDGKLWGNFALERQNTLILWYLRDLNRFFPLGTD